MKKSTEESISSQISWRKAKAESIENKAAKEDELSPFYLEKLKVFDEH